MPFGFSTYDSLDELGTLKDAQLYTLHNNAVTYKATGALTFKPSAMTGFRARLDAGPDIPAITWLIQDSTPVLRVGTGIFVFPKDVSQQLYYILCLEGLRARYVESFTWSLSDFCSIFQSEEEELTSEEWAVHLQALTSSAQYNSRVARGITNAGVHLARGLGVLRSNLLNRLSTTQQVAKQRLTKEQVQLDADARNAAAGLVAVSGVAKNVVEGTLQLIAKPLKAGVRVGVQQGKAVAEAIQANQQPDVWTAPTGPSAGQEVFGALKGALGQVVGSAISHGKVVAAKGGEALTDVVSHRFGNDAAEVSQEGVKAVVNVVQTVAAVKTFGAVGLTRMTLEDSVKEAVARDAGIGGQGAASPHVRINVKVNVRSDGQTVKVRIKASSRIVLVRLGVTRPLIPYDIRQEAAAAAVGPTCVAVADCTPAKGATSSALVPNQHKQPAAAHYATEACVATVSHGSSQAAKDSGTKTTPSTNARVPPGNMHKPERQPRVKVLILPVRDWLPGEGGYVPPAVPAPRRFPDINNILDDLSKDFARLQTADSSHGSRPSSRGSQGSAKGLSPTISRTGSRARLASDAGPSLSRRSSSLSRYTAQHGGAGPAAAVEGAGTASATASASTHGAPCAGPWAGTGTGDRTQPGLPSQGSSLLQSCATAALSPATCGSTETAGTALTDPVQSSSRSGDTAVRASSSFSSSEAAPSAAVGARSLPSDQRGVVQPQAARNQSSTAPKRSHVNDGFDSWLSSLLEKHAS